MTLPLNGVRVLDLTNVLAGPFCTYQLALMGAEVIKIEQPVRGDLARRLGGDQEASRRGMGTSFVAMNTGKQSVTIDLKSAAGKAIFKRFVAEADVVVENYRPGVMTRLDLDYETLRAIRPSLIYCAISGFGQDGPFAQRPAYDQIVQGVAGVMSITGDAQSAPLRVGFPVADTVSGLTAAFAVAAALNGARASGEGRFIDVSMLESMLATMGWPISNYLNAGMVPQPFGNNNFTAAPSGTFTAADGVLNIAANEDKQFAALCETLGRPDLATDPRFADRHIRKANREALTAELEPALATKDAATWESLLVKAGVPAGRVFSVPEIIEHEHLKQRGFLASLDSPSGPQRVTRCGFRFKDANPVSASPAPELAADTRSWLARLGYEDAEIARFEADGVV